MNLDNVSINCMSEKNNDFDFTELIKLNDPKLIKSYQKINQEDYGKPDFSEMCRTGIFKTSEDTLTLANKALQKETNVRFCSLPDENTEALVKESITAVNEAIKDSLAIIADDAILPLKSSGLTEDVHLSFPSMEAKVNKSMECSLNKSKGSSTDLVTIDLADLSPIQIDKPSSEKEASVVDKVHDISENAGEAESINSDWNSDAFEISTEKETMIVPDVDLIDKVNSPICVDDNSLDNHRYQISVDTPCNVSYEAASPFSTSSNSQLPSPASSTLQIPSPASSTSLLPSPALSMPGSLETVTESLSANTSLSNSSYQPVTKTVQVDFQSSAGLLPYSQNPFLYESHIAANNLSRNVNREENHGKKMSDGQKEIIKDNWDHTQNENTNPTLKYNKNQTNSTVYNMNLEVLEDENKSKDDITMDTAGEQHYQQENPVHIPIANKSINQEQTDNGSNMKNHMPVPGVMQYGYCKDRGIFQPVMPSYYQNGFYNADMLQNMLKQQVQGKAGIDVGSLDLSSINPSIGYFNSDQNHLVASQSINPQNNQVIINRGDYFINQHNSQSIKQLGGQSINQLNSYLINQPINPLKIESMSSTFNGFGAKPNKRKSRSEKVILQQKDFYSQSETIYRYQLEREQGNLSKWKEKVVKTNQGCLVCGAPSSGAHYNVVTCEGCKGFFRRTVTGGMKYMCKFSKSCPVFGSQRKRCKACRFAACISKGMSIQCVINRMKKMPDNLESILALQTEYNNYCPSQGNPSPGDGEDNHDSSPKATGYQKFDAEYQKSSSSFVPYVSHQDTNRDTAVGISNTSYQSSAIETPPPSSVESQASNPSSPETNNDWQRTGSSLSSASSLPISVSRSSSVLSTTGPSPVQTTLYGASSTQLTNSSSFSQAARGYVTPSPNPSISTTMGSAASCSFSPLSIGSEEVRSSFPPPSSSSTPSPQQQANHQELIPLTPQELKPLTRPEFEFIHKLTYFQSQLDHPRSEDLAAIEYRSQLELSMEGRFTSIFLETTNLSALMVLEFCKRLPGFSTLNNQDQVSILKGSSSKNVLLRTCRCFNTLSSYVVFSPNLVYPMMQAYFPSLDINPLISFFHKVTYWQLDNVEFAILTAITVLNQKNRVMYFSKVKEVQATYLTLLRTYLKSKTKDHETRVNRILDLLGDINNLGELYERCVISIGQRRGQYPKLLTELWHK